MLVFFGANEAVFLLPVFSVNRRQQVMKRRAARFDWLVLLTFVLAVAIEGVVYYWQIQPVYYFGEGIPKDYKEAMKWYKLATDQNHADAQY